jgi:hypothetical protein
MIFHEAMWSVICVSLKIDLPHQAGASMHVMTADHMQRLIIYPLFTDSDVR